MSVSRGDLCHWQDSCTPLWYKIQKIRIAACRVLGVSRMAPGVRAALIRGSASQHGAESCRV